MIFIFLAIILTGAYRPPEHFKIINHNEDIPEGFTICKEPNFYISNYYCNNTKDGNNIQNTKWFISHPTCAYIGVGMIGIIFLCFIVSFIKKMFKKRKEYQSKRILLQKITQV
ncbi:hypothetical protein EHP00_784 [Ecytonucleospora hepatopenaei]|uniref:Uncharacterized protein n=1 Tax=Ecytonucleospora hepatopenaei TaxID=646526 RepID=A0A1W0E7Y8_9MICR|nr:hypothetical protein EHP00_784 [Ecytonucleospora hepatopenaei]